MKKLQLTKWPFINKIVVERDAADLLDAQIAERTYSDGQVERLQQKVDVLTEVLSRLVARLPDDVQLEVLGVSNYKLAYPEMKGL